LGDRLNLYAPFAKVEQTPDGGREVWGFATLERVDKQGEIIDYPTTVEALKAWSDEIASYTQGKSLGNIRLMHASNPVGKVIDWQEGETEIDGQTVKGIHIGTRVPPHRTDVISDIDEGILTGFSIGGSYAKRWFDPAVKATRYTPKFAEISYVDNPAVPGASFDMIKMAEGGLMVDGELLTKATDEEREKLHFEAEERAKKYGIAVKEGGHLTPPKGKPTDAEEYGDPTNYAYPIDEAHVKAAVGYFNHEDMREKGGYSEEEWAVIGKRIADAANKLVGEGHEFKDGAIETSEERKEAEKAALADLRKRASEGGQLSHGDIRQLISAAVNKGPLDAGLWVMDVYDDHAIIEDWDSGKYYSIPYEIKDGEAVLGTPTEVRQTWTTVEGAEKAVKTQVQKADAADEKVAAKIKAIEDGIEELKALQAKDPDKNSPEDKAVSEKIAALEAALEEVKAAQEKDDKSEPEEEDDAEKAAQALGLLKAATSALEKRGVAVSAPRRKHLRHAIDHIHHALGNEDEVEDKDHIAMTDGKEPEGDKGDAADKGFTGGDLQKAVGPVVADAINRALQGAGLAKATDVQSLAEGLAKQAEQISQLEGQVKTIADQPVPGGPFLGAAPMRGGAASWGGMQIEALKVAQETATDPLVKDAIGRQLAIAEAEAMFTTAGQRPTAPPR